MDVFDTYETGRGNPITGPIVVEGAQPGDVLQVDILDFEVDTWGWTCFVPGFGLLAEDFPKPGLLHWDVRDGFAYALGLKVPTAPFPGVVGVCPAGPGQPFSVVPPRSVGGNVDIRQLVAGSTVYLPIEVEGAWFGAGDGHARQGDGEVCGSAVEIESRGRLRLTLRRDLRLTSPAFESPPDPSAGEPDLRDDRRRARPHARRAERGPADDRVAVRSLPDHARGGVPALERRRRPADQRGRRPAQLGRQRLLPARPRHHGGLTGQLPARPARAAAAS